MAKNAKPLKRLGFRAFMQQRRMGDKKNIVLHIGVQFKGAVGILGTRIIKRTISWTRTCIVFMPQETSSKKPKT